MTVIRLVFAEPAANDLTDIVDHIALDSPAAAEDVYRAIVSTADRLRAFPELGHKGRIRGTREINVARLPFLIVYEFGADTVTILAVFHTSRDLARALRARLP